MQKTQMHSHFWHLNDDISHMSYRSQQKQKRRKLILSKNVTKSPSLSENEKIDFDDEFTPTSEYKIRKVTVYKKSGFTIT